MRNYKIITNLGFKPEYIFQAQDNKYFPYIMIVFILIIGLEIYNIINGTNIGTNFVIGVVVVFIIFLFFYNARIKSVNTFYKGQLYHVRNRKLTKFDKDALEIKRTKLSVVLQGKNKNIPLHISIKGRDSQKYVLDYYNK